jgi:hypothetical protein
MKAIALDGWARSERGRLHLQQAEAPDYLSPGLLAGFWKPSSLTRVALKLVHRVDGYLVAADLLVRAGHFAPPFI